jgi:hypothetical protein
LVMAELVDIAGAVLAILMISRITRWQGIRAEQARVLGVVGPGSV